MHLTPEGHVLAMRLVLAAARMDRDSQVLVMEQIMEQLEPVDVIWELVSIVVNFATALDALGYLERIDQPPADTEAMKRGWRVGAVEVIEDWLRGELDKHVGSASE